MPTCGGCDLVGLIMNRACIEVNLTVGLRYCNQDLLTNGHIHLQTCSLLTKLPQWSKKVNVNVLYIYLVWFCRFDQKMTKYNGVLTKLKRIYQWG